MSTLATILFVVIGVILILIGLTIAKQITERKKVRPFKIEPSRTTLGKDLSEE